jgi:hypothetical protein
VVRVFGRIWRSLNPEIVIGFLIATLFWIGILGWQAAYTPTEMEKQKCYEAAQKSGHKSEECKSLWERTTSDPVAFFTLWLVIFTGGLTVSTVLLWRAGEKQFRYAIRSGLRQSRDMRASIAVSQRAAASAIKQSEAMIQAERPYVYLKIMEPGLAFDSNSHLIIPDIKTDGRLRFHLVNAGRTPAMLEEFKEFYPVIDGALVPPPLDPMKDRGRLLPVGSMATGDAPSEYATNLLLQPTYQTFGK